MRRVIVSMIVSADGKYAGVGGDLSVVPFDDGFSRANVELLRGAGTMLSGRTGFLGFMDHWPQVKDDESQPAVEREISRLNTAIEKVVVSDTLTDDDLGVWTSSTRIVRRADAVDAVAALKTEDRDGDIIVFGSATMWNALAPAGVVDELRVLVGPALIGDGASLYSGPRVQLRLRDVARLADSELVMLTYDVQSSGEGGDAR
jgi:dihydrofolate reductase